MILYFDTETTGIPNPRVGHSDASQPRIVQIGMVLSEDDDGDVLADVSLMIVPDGWRVPTEAARVHGITTEIASSAGVPIIVALSVFANLCRKASAIVAHNMRFDREMVEIEWERIGRDPSELRMLWPADSICTLELSAGVLNLPPTPRMVAKGMQGPKAPSLAEAYVGLIGPRNIGAHSARGDARAVLDIHRELVKVLNAKTD